MPVRPDQVPLDTAKRWAKRLVTTSRSINPDHPLSLSQGQLAVAQMLGHPHWHALHTALTQTLPSISPAPSLTWEGDAPTTPEAWYAFWHKALTLEGHTDVHVEIRNNVAQVRVRSFGKLIPFITLERQQAIEGVALILPERSAENFLSHDGKFLDYVSDTVVIPGNTQVGRDTIEVRYQSLPVYPEGLDIVLGRPRQPNINLEAMRLPKEVEASLVDIVSRSPGLFLCTGTAGSGRSTLVAALVRKLAQRQKNIRQYAVDASYNEGLMAPYTTFIPVKAAGPQATRDMTFSLQAAIRCDPDTLVIGELRSEATGLAAWKAVQAGTRVLTTIHSSGRVLERLEDFGDRPWADIVTGWANCRLLGVLCQACSEPQANGTRRVHRQGCSACRHRGYTGRQLVLDLWEVKGGVPHKRFAMIDQVADLVRGGMVDDDDVEGALGVRTQP